MRRSRPDRHRGKVRIHTRQTRSRGRLPRREPRRLPARPAAVRPLARPSARAAQRAPRRRGRDLGEARGLQLRARVRRQQGAQARVPRRGRARPGLRHARLDRRRPVEPHPAGRRGRRAARARLRARAGALGRLARPRSTTRSGTSCSRGSWAPTCASIRPGSTSRSGRAGSRRSPIGRGRGREAVCDPGRRVRPSARRARLRALGRRGRRAGAGARPLLRHDHRLLGDGLDAGRDDRRLRSAGQDARRCSGSTALRRSSRPGSRSPASRG